MNIRLFKYKYIFITAVLLLIYGMPFYLRQKNKKWEVYPSVIFPSGAGLVSISDNREVKFQHLEIWIYKNDWQPVKISEFLGEIPEWYIYPLYKSNFGFTLKDSIYRYSDKKSHNDSLWLNRLQRMGASKDIFLVKKYEIVVDGNNEIKHKQLVNEKVFQVY